MRYAALAIIVTVIGALFLPILPVTASTMNMDWGGEFHWVGDRMVSDTGTLRPARVQTASTLAFAVCHLPGDEPRFHIYTPHSRGEDITVSMSVWNYCLVIGAKENK